MNDWEQLVAAGKRVLEQISLSSWELADITLAAVPAETPKAESNKMLIKWISAIGYDGALNTMRNIRQTAIAWPPDKRSAAYSINIHKRLNGHPDRFKLIKRKNLSQKKVEDLNMSTVPKIRRISAYDGLRRFESGISWMLSGVRMLEKLDLSPRDIDILERKIQDADELLDRAKRIQMGVKKVA